MLEEKDIQSIRSGFDTENKQLPVLFNALSDPTRFRIMRIMMKYKYVCATDIAAVFQITVSAASQQLKLLEQSGLLEGYRVGQMVCYRVRRDTALVRSLVRLLKKK